MIKKFANPVYESQTENTYLDLVGDVNLDHFEFSQCNDSSFANLQHSGLFLVLASPFEMQFWNLHMLLWRKLWTENIFSMPKVDHVFRQGLPWWCWMTFIDKFVQPHFPLGCTVLNFFPAGRWWWGRWGGRCWYLLVHVVVEKGQRFLHKIRHWMMIAMKNKWSNKSF